MTYYLLGFLLNMVVLNLLGRRRCPPLITLLTFDLSPYAGSGVDSSGPDGEATVGIHRHGPQRHTDNQVQLITI